MNSSTTIIFEGVSITTTVISNPSMVDSRLIRELSSIIYINRRPIVGLDIDWKPNIIPGCTNKFAILQLCVGTRWLILELLHFNYIPQSLKNFLGDATKNFVGVGIEEYSRKLYRDYGIECRKFGELGPWALMVLGRSSRGLANLAHDVEGVNMEKPRGVTSSDWSYPILSMEQIEYATVDAYASFLIGKKLMEQN